MYFIGNVVNEKSAKILRQNESSTDIPIFEAFHCCSLRTKKEVASI